MYYVREYSPTCKFLKIINWSRWVSLGLVDYFSEFTVVVYSPLHHISILRFSVEIEIVNILQVL